MTDEEAIFAYIDGELEGEALARVKAAIDADPALQAIAAEHRALSARLQGAFSTVLETPVPTALSAIAISGGHVASVSDARSRREQRRSSWDLSHWAAIAATLVAGVIGGAIFSGGSIGPVTEWGGRMVVSGSLETALSTQLASSQSASAPTRIGLTFRNHSGAICRSFTAEGSEGVACRQDEAWLLKGLLPRDNVGASDYRMATSSATAELVDSLIVGEALDEVQERAARSAGWAPANGS